jgi:hypothetical protein
MTTTTMIEETAITAIDPTFLSLTELINKRHDQIANLAELEAGFPKLEEDIEFAKGTIKHTGRQIIAMTIQLFG